MNFRLLIQVLLLTTITSCGKKDPKDFHGLAWGDPPDKVMEIQGGKPYEKTKTNITYETNLHGLSSQLGYLFAKDKLASAIYITTSDNNRIKVEKTFIKLSDSLTKEYGEVEANMFDEGQIIKKEWKLPKTMIMLSYRNGQIMLSHTSYQFQEMLNGVQDTTSAQ